MLLLWPLLLVGLVAMLLPVMLWQRYRLGKARRRAVGWLVRLNAWLLLISNALFLASAWVMGHWIEAALQNAAAGLAVGVLAGVVGLAVTRFERGPEGVFYTPNRWLVLALTLVVAARLVFGLYRAWLAWSGDEGRVWMSQQGDLLAVAGLLAGYYLAFTWGLRRRLRSA